MWGLDIEQILTEILHAVRERKQLSYRICTIRHYEENDIKTVERLTAERALVLKLFKKLKIEDPGSYDFKRLHDFEEALKQVDEKVHADGEYLLNIQVRAHGMGQEDALHRVADWLDKSQLLSPTPRSERIIEAIRTGAFLDQSVDASSGSGSSADTGGVPVESIQDQTRIGSGTEEGQADRKSTVSLHVRDSRDS